jgi:Ca2+-binding EF-hand superfamily protein
MEMSDAEYKSGCILIYNYFAKTTGGIDFETFKNYYKKVRPWTSFTSRTSDNSWRRMFEVYDLDGNGFVVQNEAWSRLKRN